MLVPTSNIKPSSQANEKAAQTVAKLDITNLQSIETIGEEYAGLLGNLSKSLMTDETKLKNMGEVGNSINNMLLTTKSLDVSVLDDKPNFITKIFTKAGANVEKFVNQQKTVQESIKQISDRLFNDRATLLHENARLDAVYINTIESLEKMTALLDATREQSQLFIAQTEQKKLSQQSEPDDLLSLEIQKDNQFIDRLEKTIDRLQTAKALVMRQLPQIKIMQEANIAECDNIKDICQVAIPLWESTIGLYISQLLTKTAAENSSKIKNTINATIQQNAILMNQNVQDITAMSTSSVITSETLAVVNGSLISSIETLKSASDKAKQARADTFLAIQKMDSDLTQALIK